jgi:hypothetical protein
MQRNPSRVQQKQSGLQQNPRKTDRKSKPKATKTKSTFFRRMNVFNGLR